MSDTFRAFIAVNINPDIQDTIRRIQDHLKKTNCDVKWVKSEHIHITLKFLGNIDNKQSDRIIQLFKNNIHKIKKFKIQLTQLEAFPNKDHPRILWICLNDGKRNLSRLNRSIQKALKELGIHGDRKPFRPHITIGRIRSLKNIHLLNQSMNSCSLLKGQTQSISRISFFKSTLSSEGPVYEIICQNQLTS